MSQELPIKRVVLRVLQEARRILVLLMMPAILFVCPVSAEFDSTGWKRYRDIRIPKHLLQGLVGIALESDVLEHCRPDLGDLRVVSGAGSVVATTMTEASAPPEPETFPVRTFRVVEKPGKYTEIVIDKTAKVISSGIRIKTRSKDFVRTVEVLGSQSSGESYVIRRDGLIADMSSPLPVRQLSIFHPLNNFRYLFVRILSENQPLLKIDGIECFPAQSTEPLSKPLPAKIVENRTDPSTGMTVVVVDLGKHRFPPTSLSIGTSNREFIKKAVIYGAVSETTEEWAKVWEGVLFRIRRNEAMTERLTAKMDPYPTRLVKLELSGGSRGAVTVEKILPVGTMRLVVFAKGPEDGYKLYYDNPEAKSPAPGAGGLSSASLQSAVRVSSEVELSAEHKNVRPPKPVPIAQKPVAEPPSSFGKWLGIAMLLMGLLLLFSLMLRALSARRTTRRRSSPPTINTRI